MTVIKFMIIAMIFTIGSHGEEPQKQGLVITEHSLVYEESLPYVTGVLANVSNYPYSHAQIEVSLYNSDEIHVGSMLESVNGLEPYGIWEFKIPLTNDVTSYTIPQISGM